MTVACLVPRATDVLAFGRDWEPGTIAALERRAHPLVPTVSLEARLGVRRTWTNADLGAAAELLPSEANKVLAYASIPGRAVLAPPVAIKRWLDDKAQSRRLLARAGVRVPAGVVVRSAGEWPRELGFPLIAQPRIGSTGSGVRAIRHDGEVPARFPRDGLLVSAFVDGIVLNTHVLVGSSSIVTAPWSVQAAGIAELGGGPFAYGGNDFAAEHGMTGNAGLALARQIGEIVRSLGWRGVLGIDAIYDDQHLHVLEINPRLQGSSWLLAEAQATADEPVLGAAHRRLFVDGVEPVTIGASGRLHGAFLIIRADTDVAAPPHDLDGAWTWDHSRLEHHRAAFGLGELRDGEVLIDGTARDPVVAGGVLARVASRQALLETSGRLTTLGRELVGVVRARVTPASADARGAPS